VRASVLAIYSSGIYIGAGLGLGLGGLIVDRWELAYAGVEPPFGLRGWQVAFFAVGLPGLLLAAWVRTLREPRRGQADGLPTPDHPHPFREFGRELTAVLPPLTAILLLARGGGGALAVNLAAAVALGLLAWLLAAVTGDVAQWIALAIGLYSAVSWVQAVSLRDRPTAALVFRTPSLALVAVGCALLSFTGYGVGYWTPPFFLRHHEVTLGQLGTVLGGLSALGGWLGVTFGGVLADRWRRDRASGRIRVAQLCAVLPFPVGAWMLLTPSLTQAYAAGFLLNIITSSWIGVGASTVQDLVLPRMRALASAFYLLVITFIGLALGPYTIGKLSDLLGDLRLAMAVAVVSNGVAFVLLVMAARRLGGDEASLKDRARAAGEAAI
jgi:MFS family permease